MSISRRTVVTGIAGGTVLTAAGGASAATADDAAQNILSAAGAWRQTAAERDMLYRQAFNIARDRVDAALRGGGRPGSAGRRPLAVVSDVDDTVLSSDTYWARLLTAGKQAFDDTLWDTWIRENGPTPTPGAVDFTHYAASRGVEVFYVSSRDQGPDTQELGVANLRHAGLAFADDAHVTMLRESSDKEPAQREIAARYEVVAYLGDNLNDFRRRYYVDSVPQRKALAAQDAEHFGRDFVLFPNNTDGHWMRAVFGESEPADTPAYRARMLRAARGELN
ncbi:5'-nucleotidase, lipoprotein e(P4) family [Streptomyces xanthii]|uniref:Acid phosphatase n=1 Tax=Streptomyces xanthii TaxID=2768069 RepID=A0A7H1BHB4_9ACTN|nr:HAD family acid phosphatase [Streptomyces xanthii]QNS08119.1 acid phosphatase [Streptomyces xanthii]